MSTPFDELNDAVSDIYEAAVTPARWHDALRATVQFVRGERGMLSITNSSTGHLDVTETFQLDPNLIARWEVEHDRVNPWGDAIRQPAEGQVGRASDFKPYHLLERNRTFREIVIPLGIYDACWTALAANQLQRGFISAFQGQDRGPFSSESVERMTVLSPHLVRSARIYSQLGELRLRTEIFEQALDELSFGLMTCTSDGRVVTVNRRAEVLFTDGSPLRLRNGQLGCSDPDQSNRLKELISIASATSSGDSSRGGGVPALQRNGEPESTLTVTVIPLSRRTESPLKNGDRGRATVLLTFTHPNQSLRVPHGALNELFGLTRAEAELALSLARGLSLADYASQSGISIGTARWTFKNIQSKTGVGRQAELVALVNRSLAPLIDDEHER